MVLVYGVHLIHLSQTLDEWIHYEKETYEVYELYRQIQES